MKKILLSVMVLAMFSTAVNAFGMKDTMDKVMRSWYGEDINAVIDRWGYPTDEKNIAGRKLIIWSEGTEHSYDTWIDNEKGWSFGSATAKEEEVCTKIFEVDANNKIIKGQWRGESCPFAQCFAKKLVNPRNNLFD